jgi:WD40 repeat protein
MNDGIQVLNDENIRLISMQFSPTFKEILPSVAVASLTANLPPSQMPSFAAMEGSLLGVYSTSNQIVTIDSSCRVFVASYSISSDCIFTLKQDPATQPRKSLGARLHPSVLGSTNLFAVTSDGNFLVSAGHWNNSFIVTNLSDMRTIATVAHHKDIVTCVSVGTDDNMLVSGSRDTTVMVWVEDKCFARATFDRYIYPIILY